MFVGRSARPAGMHRLPVHVDGLPDDVIDDDAMSVPCWLPVDDVQPKASVVDDMFSEQIELGHVDNSVIQDLQRNE